jgi:hypothetical protein
MSILDYNLVDVPDEQIVPAGEYSVKILSAKAKTSKSGKPMIEVAIGFPDEIDARTCFHYITLPAEGDDDSVANGKLRRLKEFYEAFGIAYDGPVDLDLVTGETAFAIIAEEEDEEYGASNRVKRFLNQK